ncbi:threonine/serine exporter family protein [Aeromicrobium choanae]|uniref:Uncharacterized membrane protein YjjP, DUF1212 family n=1 Tax=Aeromicrobium choanae TaxID=1736691 RepID=A0A1T4YY69_9ACTN|nr:threonine/serine exporter family protein [Aeromicrobium choanae]SKB06750.1 Uncharacterized membrane protein YjjP, DUF1212 family [Aeromicrobium choanae]
MTTSAPQTLRIMDLALRAGEMLLSNGAGTADVSATMSSIARHFGLRGTYVDVTYIMLTMVHDQQLDEPPLILRRNVVRRETDFEDVTAIDRLVSDLLNDEIDLDEARSRLASISASGHARPRWVVIGGAGLVGAGVAMMLGGEAMVTAIAFLAAVVIEYVRRPLEVRRLPDFYIQVVGGLCASLIAVTAAAASVPSPPSLVIAANIVVLLAGLGLMGAIQDALTGYHLTAVARLLEVVLATGGIVAGVSGGIMVGRMLGVDLGSGTSWPDISHLPFVTIGAGLAAAGFAVQTYAPWSSVPVIAAIGAGAGALSAAMFQNNIDRPWAAGIAAFLIGVVSYPASRALRIPALVLVVPAIVPLLPGLTIYRSLAQLSEESLSGIFAGITAMAVAVALAAGVILGEYAAQPLGRETRRLERRLSGPRLVGPFRAKSRRK